MESEFIPAVDMDRPCAIIAPVSDEEDMANLTQHLRAKVIEKALREKLDDPKMVGLALMAAAGADKQTMDRKKLEVAKKAVDNEAESLAFIGGVLDRIGGNPFAKGSAIDVDKLLNEDDGKLPDIVIQPGALEVGVTDLNFEKFMNENKVSLEIFNRDNDEE
jgi:hypothetical protein